ncbi:MAG: hypothetical protein WCI04_01485 [archaeon]
MPKFVVAILYGFSVFWAIAAAAKIFPILSNPSLISTIDFSSLIGTAVLVIIVSAVAFFLDIIFSGFYPVLVESALNGKKVSFKLAFLAVKKKLWLILYSGMLAWIIVGVASLLLSGVLIFFNLNEISWVISFAVAFSFIFFFYFLFPTIVYNDDSVKSSFRDAVCESFGHGKIVVLYSLIPFTVSVVKFVVAFFASNNSDILIYWVLVFLTAGIYSIHAVLTQILFERFYLKKKKI